MQKPLAIDLFCGLGGWTDGLLAEGYDVTGVDIEEHAYGDQRYQGKLLLQDVTTLHGSQFKDARLIVASPPCQAYSYMAMPWKLAKAKAAAIRADTTGEKLVALNRLFNECFRIQREASFAAGHHIPMVVENVRGAQPWVGRARGNFGSFYLWGDVPALMPSADSKHRGGQKVPGFRFDGSGKSFQSASVAHVKVPSEVGRRTDPGKGARFTSRDCGIEGAKNRKDLFGIKGSEGYDRDHPNAFGCKNPRTSNHSPQRKMASAMIAKIPLPLARYIAATFRPRAEAG